MKRQVIIHLGHGKTGSSSIQQFLLNHPDLLIKRDYIYPLPTYIKPNIGNFDGSLPDWFEASIIPIIQTTPEKNLIFSSETAFNRTGSFFDSFQKYSSEYDIKIVIFARDPIPTISSTFLQRLKKYGECSDFSMFLKDRNYILGSLKKLSYIIQRSRSVGLDLDVLNFRQCHNVVESFLNHCLGFHTDDFKSFFTQSYSKSNLSISYEVALLLLVSNQLFNPGRFHKINKILQAYPEIYSSGKGIELYPSDTDMERLQETNRSHMKAINKYLRSRDIEPLLWDCSADKQIIHSNSLKEIQILMKNLSLI